MYSPYLVAKKPATPFKITFGKLKVAKSIIYSLLDNPYLVVRAVCNG